MLISFLGGEVFILGVLSVYYWTSDKTAARHALYIVLLGAYLNFFLKNLLAVERPPAQLRLTEQTKQSYGFPSGHAQDSAVFYGFLASEKSSWPLTLIYSTVVIAIGISRVYLGVHYVSQVIGGWIVGLTYLVIASRVRKVIPNARSGLLDLAIPIMAIVLLLAPYPIFSGGLREQPGLVCGFLLGFSLGSSAEKRYTNFPRAKSLIGSFRRILIGAAISGFSYVISLQLIRSDVIGDFLVFALMGSLASFVAPMVFVYVERRSPNSSLR